MAAPGSGGTLLQSFLDACCCQSVRTPTSWPRSSHGAPAPTLPLSPPHLLNPPSREPHLSPASLSSSFLRSFNALGQHVFFLFFFKSTVIIYIKHICIAMTQSSRTLRLAKLKLWPHGTMTPHFLPLLPAGSHHPTMCFYEFDYSDFSIKWNQIVCVFLGVAC